MSFSDVLSGGEIDIQTMDQFALLCGIAEDHTPSALLANAPTSSVGQKQRFTAIHLVNNHFVVSHQYFYSHSWRYVNAVYDYEHDDDRIQHLLPQLKSLYENVRDASDVEYYVPRRQGSTSSSGLFAAAIAAMLIHGENPYDPILDEDLLRCYVYRCLQNGKVELFPTWRFVPPPTKTKRTRNSPTVFDISD